MSELDIVTTSKEIEILCEMMREITTKNLEISNVNGLNDSKIKLPEIVTDEVHYFQLLRKETNIFLKKTRKTQEERKPETISLSYCQLCKRNGECELFWKSHCLRDELNILRCPILRRYICPKCGATGDEAHTSSYCPLIANELPVTAIRTLRMGCGCYKKREHYCQLTAERCRHHIE